MIELSKLELSDHVKCNLPPEVIKYYESEVEKLTQEIKSEKRNLAFVYCRRGAIYRKLGKLQSAMNDLQEVSLKKNQNSTIHHSRCFCLYCSFLLRCWIAEDWWTAYVVVKYKYEHFETLIKTLDLGGGIVRFYLHTCMGLVPVMFEKLI